MIYFHNKCKCKCGNNLEDIYNKISDLRLKITANTTSTGLQELHERIKERNAIKDMLFNILVEAGLLVETPEPKNEQRFLHKDKYYRVKKVK